MAIDVLTAPTVEPISLELAWAHLRLDTYGSPAGTPHDLWLEQIGIPAARAAAEKFTQRSFAAKTLRLSLDVFPIGAIKLWYPPVVSVDSISYVDRDGVTQTMAPGQYSLDARSVPGWVFPAYGTSWPDTLDTANAVEVTFRTGASAVEPDVKAAILLMLGHLFENREDEVLGAKPERVHTGFESLLFPHRIGMGV